MTRDPHTASVEAIELHKAYVFRHWMRQFEVSGQELSAAVQAVGPYENPLRDYFRHHGATRPAPGHFAERRAPLRRAAQA